MRAETCDYPNRDIAKIRGLTKFFAGVHIGQVDLYERDRHAEKRVAQGDTGVRERAGVDDDEIRAVVLGSVNGVNQFMFRITL